MSVCELCGAETVGTLKHEKCQDEWNRRFSEHVCTRCGRRAAPYEARCNTCTAHSEYEGYSSE